MRAYSLLATFLIVFCGMARLSLAQASVYESIPEEALGFAVVQDLEGLDAKLSGLAGRLRLPPQMSHPLMLAKAALGLTTALDDKGSLAVVVMPNATPATSPAVVLLAPVTDYEQFVTALNGNAKLDSTEVVLGGQLMRVAKAGRFAALAPQEHRESLEQLASAKSGSVESVAPLKDWLSARDIAVVARPAGVKLMFGGMRHGLETTVKALPAGGPEAQTVRAVFDMYDRILRTAQEECQWFAAGLNVDGSGGWHLTTRTTVTPSGTIAAGLRTTEPVEGGALSGLPAGPFVFAFGGVFPSQASRTFIEFSLSALKSNPAYKGLSDADLKTLSEAQMAMATGVDGVAGVLGVAGPKQPLYSSFVGALHVADSAKFLAQYRAKSEAVRDLLKGKSVPGLITDVQTVKVGDVEALEVTTDMSAAMAAGGPPQSREMLEQMFGPGGKVKVYLAAADKDSVVISYINKNSLTKGLAAFRSSDAALAGSALVAQTQPLLPAGAQWEAYLSVSGAIKWIQQVLSATLPPQSVPQFPQMGESPPLGLAVKASGSLIETDLVLPSATLDALGEFAAKARGAQ